MNRAAHLPHLPRRAVLAAALLPLALRAQAQSQRPARLITLGGAVTECVYALGAEAQLVGTDTTSLYPEAALRTPKVGYMRQLSAEGLLSLKPDAIVGTTEAGPPAVLDQVRSAGVRVELVRADHTWEEVGRKLQAVARVAGREPEARALLQKLDAEWAAVQAEVKKAPRQPRVLFILAHSGSPQVSGTGTAADALIRYAGGVNAVQAYQGYRALTAEGLASAAPDVILNTTQGIEALGGEAAFWQRPEFALTPAFKRRALVAMEANHLLGFGPRLPGAVREMHARLMALTA
ncbi:MAG: ABC transporter substrate-binding protein [Acidovorax sp.]